MELRQLQTFVTITQTESFSRAAEILGYTQSALTVQIRLLENELGVKLFDRMGKKVYLTAAGRQFLDHATQIIRDINRAREFAKSEEELCGPIHVGTLESLCFSKLPRILNSFRSRHPRVPVKITASTPNQLIDMMERNQLDLIYILDRPRYNDNWNKVMEVREPIVFVASPSCGLGGDRAIGLEEIMDEPFFLTEKNENYRRELDCFLESQGMVLTPFLEISNTEFIIRMIRKNRGISYLPLFAVQEYVKRGELAVLDVADFRLAMYQQVIYNRNKWVTKEMDAFIRITANHSGTGAICGGNDI